MIYREEVRDLFSVPDDYYLAHCISADFALGKGIAVEFAKRFSVKAILQTRFPDHVTQWQGLKKKGECIKVDRIFNLITKERYFHKPTYDSITNALWCMKDSAIRNKVTAIAMPLIGCGLDKLEWPQVSKIIQDIFKDTDIEILVCRQQSI